MPDLPELYEALDAQLDTLIKGIGGVHQRSDSGMRTVSQIIYALCAAIEVKQTQEFHEYLNADEKT